MIKRPTQRHDAESTYPSESWFQTHNAIIGSRPKYRTPGLASKCDRTHHRSNGSGRTTARTARGMVSIPGIASWRRVAIGKLGRGCLTQHDSARAPKVRYRGRIVFGNEICIDFGTSSRRYTGSVENILNPSWDTD